MKTLIAVIIGITMGISLQLATAHSPCNAYPPIQPAKPIQICGFKQVVDTYGNLVQVYVCD